MTGNTPLLNGGERRPTRQGAILVLNLRLTSGNGLQAGGSASQSARGDTRTNLQGEGGGISVCVCVCVCGGGGGGMVWGCGVSM